MDYEDDRNNRIHALEDENENRERQMKKEIMRLRHVIQNFQCGFEPITAKLLHMEDNREYMKGALDILDALDLEWTGKFVRYK